MRSRLVRLLSHRQAEGGMRAERQPPGAPATDSPGQERSLRVKAERGLLSAHDSQTFVRTEFGSGCPMALQARLNLNGKGAGLLETFSRQRLGPCDAPCEDEPGQRVVCSRAVNITLVDCAAHARVQLVDRERRLIFAGDVNRVCHRYSVNLTAAGEAGVIEIALGLRLNQSLRSWRDENGHVPVIRYQNCGEVQATKRCQLVIR